jgi:hypothetical protein
MIFLQFYIDFTSSCILNLDPQLSIYEQVPRKNFPSAM